MDSLLLLWSFWDAYEPPFCRIFPPFIPFQRIRLLDFPALVATQCNAPCVLLVPSTFYHDDNKNPLNKPQVHRLTDLFCLRLENFWISVNIMECTQCLINARYIFQDKWNTATVYLIVSICPMCHINARYIFQDMPETLDKKMAFKRFRIKISRSNFILVFDKFQFILISFVLLFWFFSLLVSLPDNWLGLFIKVYQRRTWVRSK